MAETGPTITFHDNTATNDRGVTIELLPPTGTAHAEYCVAGMVDGAVFSDGSRLSYRDTPDVDLQETFQAFAREVFTLLDRCLLPGIHGAVYRAATQTRESLDMSN